MRIILLLILTSFSLSAQSLDDYFDEIRKSNPALKAKYAEYEAVLKKAEQVSAIPDPTLSFGYFVSPVETRVGPQNFKLSLMQKLPWFGTLSDYEKEMLYKAEAKRKEYESLLIEKQYELRNLFYSLYEKEQEIEYEKESLKLLEYLETIVETKLETAKSRLSDLLRLKLIISDIETKIEVLNLQISPVKRNINKVLNREINADIKVPSELEENVDISSLRDSVLFNPSVEKLDLLVSSSQKMLDAANSESMPDLTFGLDYVNVGTRDNFNDPANGQDILMPMVGISIPFFSSRYQAKEEEAKAMLDMYEFEKEELLNSLRASFENVVTSVEDAEIKIDLYKKQIERTGNIRDLLMEEYTVSGEDIEEIIRIEEKIIEYKLKKLDAETTILSNKAKLIKLAGE